MLDVRRATYLDIGLFWVLRLDPWARAMFFETEPPTWADHVAWWERPYRRFVGYVETYPVGVAWLATDDGETTISVNVARESRGLGLGSQLIRRVTEQAGGAVSAYIKPDNRSSCRAFERAGYHYVGPAEVGQAGAVLYQWP